MGDEINSTLEVEVVLHPGSGGIFIITADDQLIFSKKQEGRFPTHDEIISKLRQLLQ